MDEALAQLRTELSDVRVLCSTVATEERLAVVSLRGDVAQLRELCSAMQSSSSTTTSGSTTM